jgi:putative transposase
MPSRFKQPLVKQEQINQSWSIDFMSDSMFNGRRFRTFNLIDDCTGGALAIEIDTSLSSKRIIRILERFILERGKLTTIITDNGPDFRSKELEHWAKDNESKSSLFNLEGLCRIDTSNGSIESTENLFLIRISSLNSIRSDY